MMPGMIMLWAGSIDKVPSGWHACDGTMGTPNLRDLFIRGYKEGHYPPETSGDLYHKHYLDMEGHSHTIEAGTGLAAGEDYNLKTSTDEAAGVTQDTAHTPPYMRMIYIMKIN